MSLSAREEILQRIKSALPQPETGATAAHASIARAYTRSGGLDPLARLHLFIDRLVDYDTEIIQIEAEDGLPAAIEQAMQQAGRERMLVPAEFPAAWLPASIATVIDKQLSHTEVDSVGIVLTTCEIGIASTGTIILVHGGAQGRRLLTLLPDHHICLVRRDQVVETVPEAFAAIATQSARPITTISGPSATSDIEMTRIRGVHGPRRLTVILYGAE